MEYHLSTLLESDGLGQEFLNFDLPGLMVVNSWITLGVEIVRTQAKGNIKKCKHEIKEKEHT